MDALIALAFVGVLLAAFWPVQPQQKVARFFNWRNFWISVALLLTVFEIGSLVEIGMTLSQQYSGWSLAVSLVRASLPASLVAFLGMGLAVHLLWKRIRKR